MSRGRRSTCAYLEHYLPRQGYPPPPNGEAMNRKIVLSLMLGASLIMSPAQAAAPVLSESVQIVQSFTPTMSKAYARNLLKSEGFTPSEYVCLRSLWTKESNWRHKARNTIPVTQKGKKLYAFGIAQRLGERSHDPRVQIRMGLKYVIHRYDTPCKAWSAWQARDRRGTGWY